MLSKNRMSIIILTIAGNITSALLSNKWVLVFITCIISAISMFFVFRLEDKKEIKDIIEKYRMKFGGLFIRFDNVEIDLSEYAITQDYYKDWEIKFKKHLDVKTLKDNINKYEKKNKLVEIEKTIFFSKMMEISKMMEKIRLQNELNSDNTKISD